MTDGMGPHDLETQQAVVGVLLRMIDEYAEMGEDSKQPSEGFEDDFAALWAPITPGFTFEAPAECGEVITSLVERLSAERSELVGNMLVAMFTVLAEVGQRWGDVDPEASVRSAVQAVALRLADEA